MNKKIIYMSVIVIIGGVVLYKLNGGLVQNSKVKTVPQDRSMFSTQTNTEDEVTVLVSPKTLTADLKAIFEIQLSTHSVELNYDFLKIAELKDDAGNIYRPIYSTVGVGGHHVKGILTFPSIVKSTKKVVLTIHRINNKDRVFNWDLE